MFGRLPPCASRVRAGALVGALGARTCGSSGAQRQGSAPDDSGAGLARGALREWTLQVSPFGRLRARLPCHLAVRPLDPLAHPDGDRVQVAVCGVEHVARGLDSLQVKYDADRQEMAILSDDIDPQASVEVNAPVKFDLSIESSGSGSVKVQNIECDSCKIDTEQGTSILQSVKSQKLHVQTKGGDVICCGTVYGNIDIHASDKNSSCGCLKASSHQGAIDVYVSQLGEVALTTEEGSIAVKAPSSLRAYFKLSGKEVVVDEEAHVQEMAKDCKGDGVTVTGLMNQASKHERWINAIAPKGTVSFQHQSWFQSLKLPD